MCLSISSARFGANRHKTCDWLKIVWVLCTLNGPEVIYDGREPTEPKMDQNKKSQELGVIFNAANQGKSGGHSER